MKISVIVPIYNVKDYMKKSIESILKQDYTNIELILVDDGSTDGSAKICDEIKVQYPRVRIIHKANGGLPSARNAGIDIATGDYVIFPDPDDWVETNYISTLVSLQKQYPSALVCSGYFETYTDKILSYPISDEIQIYQRQEAFSRLFDAGNFGGFAWNKLFNLSLIKKHGLRYDLELASCQDIHFTYQYIKLVDRVVISPIHTYHYVCDGIGVMTKGLTPRRMTSLLAYQKIIELSEKEAPEANLKAKFGLLSRAIGMICVYYDGERKKRDKAKLNTIMIYIRKYSPYALKSKSYGMRNKIELKMILISPSIYAFYISTKRKILSLRNGKLHR